MIIFVIKKNYLIEQLEDRYLNFTLIVNYMILIILTK